MRRARLPPAGPFVASGGPAPDLGQDRGAGQSVPDMAASARCRFPSGRQDPISPTATRRSPSWRWAAACGPTPPVAGRCWTATARTRRARAAGARCSCPGPTGWATGASSGTGRPGRPRSPSQKTTTPSTGWCDGRPGPWPKRPPTGPAWNTGCTRSRAGRGSWTWPSPTLLGDDGLEVRTTAGNLPGGRRALPLRRRLAPVPRRLRGAGRRRRAHLRGRHRLRLRRAGLPVGTVPVAGTRSRLQAPAGRSARPTSTRLSPTWPATRDGRAIVELRAGGRIGPGHPACGWMRAYTHLMVFSGDTLDDPDRRRRGSGRGADDLRPGHAAQRVRSHRARRGRDLRGHLGADRSLPGRTPSAAARAAPDGRPVIRSTDWRPGPVRTSGRARVDRPDPASGRSRGQCPQRRRTGSRALRRPAGGVAGRLAGPGPP